MCIIYKAYWIDLQNSIYKIVTENVNMSYAWVQVNTLYGLYLKQLAALI